MAALSALGVILSLAGSQAANVAPCPVQPVPPAVDALPPQAGRHEIAFAATPSLEHPGRAWVVRLSRSGLAGPAAVEIVRLRRQSDCNRYDVEKSWQAALPSADFEVLARQVTALSLPREDSFAPQDPLRGLDDVGIDGTGVTIRLNTIRWDLTRRLHNSGGNGALLSPIFHALVAKYLPASEVPSAEWRFRGK